MITAPSTLGLIDSVANKRGPKGCEVDNNTYYYLINYQYNCASVGFRRSFVADAFKKTPFKIFSAGIVYPSNSAANKSMFV